MTLIAIRERGLANPSPVVAVDGQEHPITVADPFSLAEEAQLEWYFEEHLRFPFLDTVKAQAAAASVRAYGEALFRSIFSGCHFACDTAPVVCSNGAPAICGNGAPLSGEDLAG